MQFNSYLFILAFLPLFVVGYFVISRIGSLYRKIFLILSGLVFYYLGDAKSIIVLGISIMLNYIAASLIKKKKEKLFLVIPIILNRKH